MSEMLVFAVAGAFGLSLTAFVATSAVALPFVAYDSIKAQRRPARR